jgi:hypothetical protein
LHGIDHGTQKAPLSSACLAFSRMAEAGTPGGL